MNSIVREEACPCDCLKVILLMCEQMILVDRLQKADILALVRHAIRSVEPGEGKRKKVAAKYWDHWTSDDYYTHSTIKIEARLADRLKIIVGIAEQLAYYDGLDQEQILVLIESDIDQHFVEDDV